MHNSSLVARISYCVYHSIQRDEDGDDTYGTGLSVTGHYSYLVSREKKDVPLSRVNLREWSEKHGFFGGNKFVNTYMERDKKIMKLAVFGIPVAAFLIENFLLQLAEERGEIVARSARCRRISASLQGS